MTRWRRTIGLGEAAERVLRRVDPSGKRHSARAVAAWRAVAGDTVAEHSRGAALRENGELLVYVDSAAWAQQLSLMADDLKRRMNAHLGRPLVRSLRFTVSRTAAKEAQQERREAQAEEFYAPDEPAPIELSETERDQAAHVARSVRDPRLREVVLRVMIKDLERKKGARKKTCPTPPEEPTNGSDPGVHKH